MLRTSARNKLEDESPDSGFNAPVRKLSEEFTHALRQLHAALSRMEDVVSTRPQPQLTEAKSPEMASVLAENRHLKEVEARLQRQLKDMQHEHDAVSGQVSALSARLETLIAHLARLLDE